MRPITRRVLALVVLLAVGLLALGALPSYLGTGDPYYLTAEETDASGPAVNVTDFSGQRYPYLSTALAEGRSEGYQKGPFGLKESFTHSPFDERDALTTQNPDAERDGRVLVEYDGTRYWVAVEQVQP
ncbi:hypothetical protein [Haloprofundus halophilus]|uniref:hypothetical protein n=1 Tax=Haloprofundus halophilus TaxID=2283527 RepID=UPI000E4354FE|nr:hypothetical protein [Haloprofundus halophilus]